MTDDVGEVVRELREAPRHSVCTGRVKVVLRQAADAIERLAGERDEAQDSEREGWECSAKNWQRMFFDMCRQRREAEARAIAAEARLSERDWQPIETCPKTDCKSYYLFNPLWEDGWSPVQRANCFEGTWVFDSGLSLIDCEDKFDPIMWHPDTTPAPPITPPAAGQPVGGG